MSVSVLYACMCVTCVCWCCAGQKGVGSHGTGVTDSCELLCGCWSLNLGPLQEKQVLLTAEPSSLQPQDNNLRASGLLMESLQENDP